MGQSYGFIEISGVTAAVDALDLRQRQKPAPQPHRDWG